MKVNTLKLNNPGYPERLGDIPSPPKVIYSCGQPLTEVLKQPAAAIVGSRKMSAYGADVTARLSSALARAGVVIISGLAYGVDAAAHKAALECGGSTIAVLPTGLDEIYPASHLSLANHIANSNGALVSEYPPGSTSYKENFIARNRIVSGLSDVLIITEAAVNSGSLHTARFALEQGKTVMVVPGNITSLVSEGCNNLIKSGAVPVTKVEDVFFALNIDPGAHSRTKVFKGTKQQQKIYDLIAKGISHQEELALVARIDISELNITLTMLEIGGYIRPQGAGYWTIA